VYGGQASPVVGPVSPANDFWFNAPLRPMGFNPNLAVQLLQEEGFQLAGWRTWRRILDHNQCRQPCTGADGN